MLVPSFLFTALVCIFPTAITILRMCIKLTRAWTSFSLFFPVAKAKPLEIMPKLSEHVSKQISLRMTMTYEGFSRS